MLIHETLASGTEVVIKEDHFTQTVAIQVWVGVGSMHEDPNEHGMAHFIEHMLFKGTKRRQGMEIAAAIEGAGGEVNAYTTFDQTVLHLTVPSSAVALGIDILGDVAFHSQLDAGEIERERGVIIEEIKRSLDSPGARVGQQVFALAFAGTPAERPIIGNESSVSSFQRTQLMQFFRRWYRPDNMKVVVAGDVDAAAVLQAIDKAFGQVRAPSETLLQCWKSDNAAPTDGTKVRVAIIRGDWQKPRLELVFPAPSLEHPDSPALDLAAFALGAGELSRLARRARDQDAVVTAAGASVYAPYFGGLFEVSAFPIPERVLDSMTVLAREVQLLCELDPVQDDELERARAALKVDRIYRDETVDGQARTLGQSMRTPWQLAYDDIYAAHIHALPPVQLQRAIRRWLKPQAAAIVALLPHDSQITEEQLLKAYEAGVDAANKAQNRRVTTTAVGRSRVQLDNFEKGQINDGLGLVYRHHPQGQLFTLTMATEGGLRFEDSATAGIHHALATMVGMATTSKSFEEFVGAVEGRGASLEGFSGKDSFGFHLQCLPEFAEELLLLFAEAVLQPEFPEEQWQSLVRETEQNIATQDDSPSGLCLRRFQEQIFGEHPYKFPIYGTKASTENLRIDDLSLFYRSLLTEGPWVIAATGPRTYHESHRLLSDHLGALRGAMARRALARPPLLARVNPGLVRINKDREQSHIVHGYPGLNWADPDRAALDVLMNVLGGHGGRLFQRLREREGLAYSVSPLITYGTQPGALGSYVATNPAKENQALAGLSEEMLRLTEVSCSEAEIARAKNHIIGTHMMGLQRAEAQTSTMALMDLYGYGADDFLTYPKRVAMVDAEAVLKVAQRMFRQDLAVTVIVGPNG